ENSLHHDATGAVIIHLTDLRTIFAERMRLERRECGFSIFRRNDADDLALVREIEWIETENLAEAFDLAANRRPVFVNLDADLRCLGDFVQDSRESSASGIAQEACTRNRRQQRIDQTV